MKYIILLLLLTACYNERRATADFSRAVLFDPKLPADYCATIFPSHDSVIRDTMIVMDSLYVEGRDNFDTTILFDTVRIIHTVQLPGKIITSKVYITDTVYRNNDAALRSCQIDNSRLIISEGSAHIDRDKARGGRDNWRLIAIISLAVNGVGLSWLLRKPKAV